MEQLKEGAAMGNKKQKQAKKHHILPQSYLERFSVDEKVWVLDFHNKISYRTGIVNAACIDYFYKVKTIAKKEDDFIEQRLLSQAEGLAKPIIDKILNARYLPTGQEWVNLANFLALMYIRGPWFRQALLEMYEHDANLLLDVVYSNEDIFHKSMAEFEQATGKKLDRNYEQALETHKRCKVTCDIPRTYYVREMLEHVGSLLEVFCEMTPSLLFAPAFGKAMFVTSDKPFVQISRKFNPLCPNALLDPNIDVYFPLSSRTCLVLNYDKESQISSASEKRIAFINGCLACDCSRMVISQEQDFAWLRKNKTVSWNHEELLEMLADSKKTEPRIKIEGGRLRSKCRSEWNLLRGRDPYNEANQEDGQ
jgi:hypothetical protein